MAKITISRLFETSRVLATKAGGEIREFVEYTAQLAEVTLRTLRNGITYEDNVDCLVKGVDLRQDEVTAIDIGRKAPKEARLRWIYTAGYELERPMAYGIDARGRFYVKAKFTPAPPASQAVSCQIMVIF